MSDGIVAELSELISLKRYARSVNFRPENRIVRNGNHTSKVRGRGMEFAEVRNYQPGDEVRHMEWRITARTGKPHIKLYQEEKERPVVILVDFNPSMFFGTRNAFKSVIAARLASILAWTTIKQGDRIGGFFYSQSNHTELIPRGREAGVLPLLAALSRYTQEKNRAFDVPGKPLSEALSRMRKVVRPGSIVVLISDFYSLDAGAIDQLRRMRGNSEILTYHICDPLELRPPKPEYYAISNGSQEMVLDTTNKQVLQGYQAFCTAHINKLQQVFKSLNIQYTQVTGDSNLARVAKETFPRKEAM